MDKALAFLTDGEAKILSDLRALRELRFHVLDSSLAATRQRAFAAAQNLDAATALYHEAILCLAVEDDDCWECACEKNAKLEFIERDYIQALPIFANAMRRIDFEIAECKKAGVTIVSPCKSA